MNTRVLTQTHVIDSAIAYTLANGGATWNVNQNAPIVADGPTFIVGLMTGASAIFNLSDTEDIAQHILAYWPIYAAHNLGLWVNEGKIYIDVSEVLHDCKQAVKLAQDNNQIAIFDLQHFVEISTGGTGKLD